MPDNRLYLIKGKYSTLSTKVTFTDDNISFMQRQRQQRLGQMFKPSLFRDNQTFSRQISQSKLNNRTSLPPRSKMIRRQKVATYNTVEDEPTGKLDDVFIYTTHTPKNPKSDKQFMHEKAKPKHEIQSFNIDESFSNKHITIKKEYEPRFDDRTNKIQLNKDKIALKNYFDSHKKHLSKSQREKTSNTEELEKQRQSGNGLLRLKQGWSYKGQYVSGLFHGFGELYHNEKLVYSGNFELGYFQGYGKLQAHPSFSFMVQMKSITPLLKEHEADKEDSAIQSNWTAYFGQLHKGNITGFGELWLNSGQRIGSKWRKGAPIGKYLTVNQGNSQVD